jgi:hypothetical protein
MESWHPAFGLETGIQSCRVRAHAVIIGKDGVASAIRKMQNGASKDRSNLDGFSAFAEALRKAGSTEHCENAKSGFHNAFVALIYCMQRGYATREGHCERRRAPSPPLDRQRKRPALASSVSKVDETATQGHRGLLGGLSCVAASFAAYQNSTPGGDAHPHKMLDSISQNECNKEEIV